MNYNLLKKLISKPFYTDGLNVLNHLKRVLKQGLYVEYAALMMYTIKTEMSYVTNSFEGIQRQRSNRKCDESINRIKSINRDETVMEQNKNTTNKTLLEFTYRDILSHLFT